MAVELSRAKVVELCLRDGLYRTPSANDKLYLHYQGFKELRGEVLREYTELKCLWLQGNGLVKIQGLEALVNLKTLCLHENAIERLEGLETLTALRSLNVSKNYIRAFGDSLCRLAELDSLNAGHNALGPETACLEGVLALPKLQVLDLQANKLEDGEGVLALCASVPDLRVLYLFGNPFVKTMRHYRKRFVSACAALRFLDDRPVFDDERRRCDAWSLAFATGDEQLAARAEREEIAKIRDEKRAAEAQRIADFEAMVRNARRAAPRLPDHFVDPDALD